MARPAVQEIVAAELDALLRKFNPHQPRDPEGKWSVVGALAKKLAHAITGDDAHSAARLKSEPSASQVTAILRMGGDGSYVVNGDLRTQSGTIGKLAEKNRTTVEHIDSVMKTATLPKDMVVHRHISDIQSVFGFNETPHDLTGLSWRDHAYASTSIADRRTGSHKVEMRILVPAGTRGFSDPRLDSDEILLDRGLIFTVVRDNTPGEVVRYVDVEVSS
jgi:hypothetical protein